MKAKTRLFGEIDIEEEKIITLESGMIGLPEMQQFALIFDNEKKSGGSIKWLQSMDDPETAFPVIDPTEIAADYNPAINDDLLQPLGTLNEENTFVIAVLTVPRNVKEMSVNLKAPIVINTDTGKGKQIIVEDDVPVKFKIYELLKSRKEKAGEQACLH